MKVPNLNLVISRISFLTAIFGIISLGIGMFSPPVSGPFCTGNCIDYPYTNILSRFPRDYFWMFPAIILNLLFVGLIAMIHRTSEISKSFYSQIALSFSIISAAILIIDYFIQITVIQPSLLKGEMNGISILTQYNPHGIFIALEEIGYLIMSLALLLLVPIFSKSIKLERAIITIFILCFALTFSAFIIIAAKYGLNREYRFEVAAITINWFTLILAGFILSVIFRRKILN